MQPAIRTRLLIFLKGMAMGAADSVPGVSGGTIALISNIYDELLKSINSINLSSLRLLFTAGPKAAWSAINGNFLLTLVIGIVCALSISAHFVTWLLQEHYSYLMCFFTGLILASIYYLFKQIKSITLGSGVLVCAGVALSLILALMPGVKEVDSLLYYFFCGALAICAMILPGVSGSFILLLLGAYETMLQALRTLDWPIVLVFVAGCICGLFSFSRVLYWLLSQYRRQTLAFLLGILLGSLYALWPWRIAVESNDLQGQGGLQYFQNLAPGSYDVLTNMPISPVLALLLVLGGVVLVLGLESLGTKLGAKSNSSSTQQ